MYGINQKHNNQKLFGTPSYQLATKKSNLNSIWWVHNKLEGIYQAKFPNWENLEEEIYLKIQNANDEQFKTICKQTFETEHVKYQSLL